MGTWSVKINGNDTFYDIYQTFFDLYNKGQNPVDISKQIQNDFDDMFNDAEDKNNSLFALALAQWETKSVDPNIFQQVKEIIDSGKDLELWKGLSADDKTIEQRRIILNDFLIKISSEKRNPKRRVTPNEFITIELSDIIAFDTENNPEIWKMVSADETIKMKRTLIINKYLLQLSEERKKINGKLKPKFQFVTIVLSKVIAPDGNKVFDASEHYTNFQYSQTGSGLSWNTGGGSVFYYREQGQIVSVDWLDSQTLEVRHNKDVVFVKKDETFFYSGDQGKVIYIPE